MNTCFAGRAAVGRVPIVLAPLLLGESFAATPLGGVPLAASLALLVAGATMLVRSPLLLALMAGERQAEVLLAGRLLGVHRLEGDP